MRTEQEIRTMRDNMMQAALEYGSERSPPGIIAGALTWILGDHSEEAPIADLLGTCSLDEARRRFEERN